MRKCVHTAIESESEPSRRKEERKGTERKSDFKPAAFSCVSRYSRFIGESVVHSIADHEGEGAGGKGKGDSFERKGKP